MMRTALIGVSLSTDYLVPVVSSALCIINVSFDLVSSTSSVPCSAAECLSTRAPQQQAEADTTMLERRDV